MDLLSLLDKIDSLLENNEKRHHEVMSMLIQISNAIKAMKSED
jgi:hypothetical protein